PVPPAPLAPWHQAHCDSKMRLPAAMSLAPAVRSGSIVAGGCAAAKTVTSATVRSEPHVRLMRRIIWWRGDGAVPAALDNSREARSEQRRPPLLAWRFTVFQRSARRSDYLMRSGSAM